MCSDAMQHILLIYKFQCVEFRRYRLCLSMYTLLGFVSSQGSLDLVEWNGMVWWNGDWNGDRNGLVEWNGNFT